MMILSNTIRWIKSRLPMSKAERLARAEAEMLMMIRILSLQDAQMEQSLNEVIEALNKFSAIVGLEWNQTDSRWLKIQ